MRATRFEKELKTTLEGFKPPLLCLSESDTPFEVVRLIWWKGIVWPAEMRDFDLFKTHESPIQVLDDHCQLVEDDALQEKQFTALKQLFFSQRGKDHRNLRVFKRPSGEPSVFDLYLMVDFGSCWVGLKTQVVET